MSAFIVSKAHIDVLVSAQVHLARISQLYDPVADPDSAGAMLWRENHASVGHLYSERHGGESDTPKYKFSLAPLDLHDLPTLVSLFKLIDCFEYQSCERPGWRGSEASAFCGHLRSALIDLLPGYSDMPWQVQDAREVGRPQEPVRRRAPRSAQGTRRAV